MMPAAIQTLIDKLVAVGVPRPNYVMDSVEPGYFEGTLFLRVEDDMNKTARAVFSFLFSVGQELPPEVQQRAVNVLLPHLALKCRGQSQTGHDGLPACRAVVSYPSNCGSCHRETKVG